MKGTERATYKAFLGLLKKARQKAGVSQISTAERMGKTQTFISKCERGERRIDVIELMAFCRAYNITIEDFIKDLTEAVGAGKKGKSTSKGIK